MTYLPVYLTFTAFVYLTAMVIFYAARRKDYNHKKNTISELGELGARNEKWVRFVVFLPVGLMLLSAALMLSNAPGPQSIRSSTIGLAIAMGFGYAASALIPCEPGCPLGGGWRQNLHNLVGAVMYVGGAAGMAGAGLLAQAHLVFALPDGLIMAMAVFVLLGAVGMSLRLLFPWRGLIQRAVELIMFATLLLLMVVLVTYPETQPLYL